jgi:hypothetical protein
MAVKTLDNHIKKAFTDLGFTEDEVKNGCWLLERNEKPIAWIALHKFLEKVANKAGINFNLPTVLNCETGEIAVCVEGIDKDGNKAWSIGEASPKNCKNDYPYAMALKRLFDRVVLKLSKLAYSGIMSDSESEEFSQNAFSGENNSGSDSGAEQTKGFKIPPEGDAPIICEECTLRLSDYFDGERLVKAAELAERSKQMHGRCLCTKCAKKVQR